MVWHFNYVENMENWKTYSDACKVAFVSLFLEYLWRQVHNYNGRNISPLCWGESKEEKETHEEDEGDGAADVGDGSNSWDGDCHGLLGRVGGVHDDEVDQIQLSWEEAGTRTR